MSRVLIIGSGPAAAGAALALSRREDVHISILDIGVQLESENREIVSHLASSDRGGWDVSLLDRVSAQPVSRTVRGLPEKRSYGSDYPFRNVGQLDGLTTSGDVANAVISGAYGGFSNVWGAQIMPFADSVFRSWPIAASDMRPHYEAVLREIPYAAETDDLADLYPLLADADPLPVLSERSRRVLEAYERHRKEILAKGITVGKARLAFHAANCVRCNLCMTGCPYRLIYSAAQTLDALEKSGVLSRHSGLIALKVSEQENSASVIARELHSGRRRELEVDRIFVACGALGTVRLVAESLNLYNRDLHVFESQQFVMPAFSMRAVADPRYAEDFTLNQFNMSISTNRDPSDAAQLHFYTFNRAFIDALPAPLRTRRMENLRTHVLRRLCVALGYLPSWRSPSLIARVQPGRDELSLPKMHITAGPAPRGHNEMVRALVLRLLRAAPLLDLYPIVPMMRVAPGGKSYHWGGTFPHSASPEMLTASDRLGRVGSWKRVHLIDASVFPTIPAMTFTLTIMANAHRIASEAVELAA